MCTSGVTKLLTPLLKGLKDLVNGLILQLVLQANTQKPGIPKQRFHFTLYTPGKLTAGTSWKFGSNDFPFQTGDFQVPAVSFFQGVRLWRLQWGWSKYISFAQIEAKYWLTSIGNETFRYANKFKKYVQTHPISQGYAVCFFDPIKNIHPESLYDMIMEAMI